MQGLFYGLRIPYHGRNVASCRGLHPCHTGLLEERLDAIRYPPEE
jgi:hypothetical protein